MTEQLQLTVSNPNDLIAQAIEKGLDVESLSKLMDLQERWQSNQARKLFFEAFTIFQSKAPDLRKTKEVKFKDNDIKPQYSFATLSSITRQIAKPLQDAELSYRWEIIDTQTELRVSCLVSHVSGHTEKTTMSSAPDPSGSKNSIQARGSAISYLQRYTLIGALGLSTADVDDDARNQIEYDIDKLHKEYMSVYNQVIQIDPNKSAWHPDNWKGETTGGRYVKAIGEIRKVLFDLQKTK